MIVAATNNCGCWLMILKNIKCNTVLLTSMSAQTRLQRRAAALSSVATVDSEGDDEEENDGEDKEDDDDATEDGEVDEENEEDDDDKEEETERNEESVVADRAEMVEGVSRAASSGHMPS